MSCATNLQLIESLQQIHTTSCTSRVHRKSKACNRYTTSEHVEMLYSLSYDLLSDESTTSRSVVEFVRKSLHGVNVTRVIIVDVSCVYYPRPAIVCVMNSGRSYEEHLRRVCQQQWRNQLLHSNTVVCKNVPMSMSMSINYLYSANNRRSNLRCWRVGD